MFQTFNSYFFVLNFSFITNIPLPCVLYSSHFHFIKSLNVILMCDTSKHLNGFGPQSTCVFFGIMEQWYEIFLSSMYCLYSGHSSNHSKVTDSIYFTFCISIGSIPCVLSSYIWEFNHFIFLIKSLKPTISLLLVLPMFKPFLSFFINSIKVPHHAPCLTLNFLWYWITPLKVSIYSLIHMVNIHSPLLLGHVFLYIYPLKSYNPCSLNVTHTNVFLCHIYSILPAPFSISLCIHSI